MFTARSCKILIDSVNKALNLNCQNPLNVNGFLNGKYIQMVHMLQQVAVSMEANITNNQEEWEITSVKTCDSTSNKDLPKLSIPHNFRTWEEVKARKRIANRNCSTFKLLSYNVLAQYLLEFHPYLYTKCNPQNLKWDIRSKLIYSEILNLSPDILCLQEVQATHLNTFFSKLSELGYQSVFKQKTGDKFDGCAIYFKESMFNLVDCLNVEFFQPNLPILNRDNIGMMVKLVPRTSPQAPFVVATTHLLYNPRRTDVRLAQIQVFLAEIERFSYDSYSKKPGYLPIILTGDLNSTPDSAVIRLLDCGYVNASHNRDDSDWRKIGVTDGCQHLAVHINRKFGKNVDFSMIKLHSSDYSHNVSSTNCQNESTPLEYDSLFNSNTITHPLKLKSVYDKVKKDGKWEATTFQDFWLTVDYIYFSEHSRLNLVERLRLPTADECQVLDTLPNDVYGSDHLALAAVFKYES